jgi:hypothetical protein
MDVFVCTNDVNYTIAAAGELALRPRRALLLYDPVRCEPRRVPRAWQLPFSPGSDRLVRWLGRVRLLDTAYVPHQRVNPRLMRELRQARHLAFIDDGLDTLRRQPLNFDLHTLAEDHPLYLTFNEYADLPPWLSRFDVHRVCTIAALVVDGRKPLFDFGAADHVFIESPGLDAAAVVAALGIEPQRAVCVRHPVPAKRGALPAGCAAVEGRQFDLEASLQASTGRALYFGATMSLVHALLAGAGARNRLYAQLDDAQLANLVWPRAVTLQAASAALPGLWQVAPAEVAGPAAA